MANQVRIETFIYRINPDDDRQLQRRSIGGTSWFMRYNCSSMRSDTDGVGRDLRFL